MFSLVALFDQCALNSRPDWRGYWQQWLASPEQPVVDQCYWAEWDEASQAAAQWQRSNCDAEQTARLSLVDGNMAKLAQLADILAGISPATAALYLCRYAEPLSAPVDAASRIPGTLQLCSFNAKRGLADQEFEQRWLQQHTPVAIETQATTHYRQHRVIRTLRGEALDAIVEEQFPAAAANSPEAFFDAVGNPQKLRQHISSMQQSCARFIDFDTINVIHLSDWPLHKESVDS